MLTANNAPTLTITNGTTVILESGKDSIIEVELNDVEDGESVDLMPAPGYSNTSCLSIAKNIVTISATSLAACQIA